MFFIIPAILFFIIVFKLLWDHIFIYIYAKYFFNNSIYLLKKNLNYSPDAWALVTGATDGIGKAYALWLARLGFNLILIGRSSDKLRNTKQDIMNDSRVKETRLSQRKEDGGNKSPDEWILTGVLDFSKATDGQTVDQVIEELLLSLPEKKTESESPVPIYKNLRVIVNNAGVSYDKPTLFGDIPDGYKFCTDLVNVNVMSVLNITRACITRIDKSSRAIVINLASFSALQSTPCLAVYAASKAFIWHFSNCLQGEYGTLFSPQTVPASTNSFKGPKLWVQTVIPYFVVTKMTKLKRASFLHPDPETYVWNALQMAGIQTVTFGYWPHACVGLISRIIYFFAPETLGHMIKRGLTSRLASAARYKTTDVNTGIHKND